MILALASKLLNLSDKSWETFTRRALRVKLVVAPIPALTAIWFAFSTPEVSGEEISDGVKAALFAMGVACSMGIDLIPAGNKPAAVIATLEARFGATFTAALAGYHWLLHETNGDPLPYLAPFVVVIGFVISGVVGQFIGAMRQQGAQKRLQEQKNKELELQSEQYLKEFNEFVAAAKDEDTKTQEWISRAWAIDIILAHLIWALKFRHSEALNTSFLEDLDRLYSEKSDEDLDGNLAIPAIKRAIRQIGILSGTMKPPQ